jgi:short-subunit dehydrogenase
VKVAGANVLLTGASSGIGASLAEALAEHGATVGIVARREQRLAEVLDRCLVHAPGSRVWVADLGHLDEAERVAIEVWDAFGHLDVLVNNAAIPKVRHVTALTAADIEGTMRVNFFSPARMTLAVLPRMLARGTGSIVNVASMGGRVGIGREAAYSASKFALTGWSESLAIDLHGTGVSVRLIQPGPIDTEIWDLPGEEHATYDGPKVPPREVAEGIIAALVSDTFEHYVPDLKWVVDGKQADVDAFLAGSAHMATQAPHADGGTT